MKCAIAKHSQLLLRQAISHYSKHRETFTFLSLYSDNEPYPIDEVIDVLKLKISDLESELAGFKKMTAGLRENEFLETQLFTMKKQLIAMEAKKKKWEEAQ